MKDPALFYFIAICVSACLALECNECNESMKSGTCEKNISGTVNCTAGKICRTLTIYHRDNESQPFKLSNTMRDCGGVAGSPDCQPDKRNTGTPCVNGTKEALCTTCCDSNNCNTDMPTYKLSTTANPNANFALLAFAFLLLYVLV